MWLKVQRQNGNKKMSSSALKVKDCHFRDIASKPGDGSADINWLSLTIDTSNLKVICVNSAVISLN